MTRRGRILKEANAGPGVLVVDGNQYPFTVERMWQSSIPPRAGMLVDVTFHPSVGIESIHAVEQALQVEAEPSLVLRGGPVQRRQPEFVEPITSKPRIGALLAVAGLIVGWFFLPSVHVGFLGLDFQFSFWQLLAHVGSLNPQAPGNDALELIGVAALAGSVLSLTLRDRRAAVAGVLPLLVTCLVAWLLINGFHTMATPASELLGRDIANSLTRSFFESVHIGSGAYLAVAASVYLAFDAIRRFMATGR